MRTKNKAEFSGTRFSPVIQWLVLYICAAALLCGCEWRHYERTPPESSATEATQMTNPVKKQLLRVAYKESDRASEQIVTAFASETVELIPIILAEDEFDNFLLYTNYPADVVLIPNTTQVNPAAYALKARVDKLDKQMQEITDGIDLFPVLDAGIIDGSQYYLPLRFQLPYLLTTQSNLVSFDMTHTGTQDMNTRMEQLGARSDQLLLLTPTEGNIGSALYDALRLSGEWTADPSVSEAPVTESVLQAYGQHIKLLWELTEKTKQQYQYTHAAYPYPLISSNIVPFIHGEGCLPEVFRVFAGVNSADPVLLSCPQYSVPSAVTADITLYAMVDSTGAGSANVQAFLRHALTTSAGQGSLEGMSVCRTAADAYLDSLENQPPQVVAAGAFYQEINGLTESVRNACKAVLDQIAAGSIRNAYWDRAFSTAMEAFTDGQKSFDQCLQTLKNRLFSTSGDETLAFEQLRLSQMLMAEITRESTFLSYSNKYSPPPLGWCGFEDGAYIDGFQTYYGTFRGNIIYRPMPDSILTVGTVYKIGNVVMEYGADFDLLVYRNGTFFDLADAYKRGYITEEDAAIIAERLAQHEALRKSR